MVNRRAEPPACAQVPAIARNARSPPWACRMHPKGGMSRVSRLTHKGTPIIHLDLRDLKPGEFAPIFEQATSALLGTPPRSARVVTDVEGARFDAATLSEFERFIRRVTPHIAANAIMGVSGIRRVAWLGLKPFYGCPAELCDTMEAAKDWVAGV